MGPWTLRDCEEGLADAGRRILPGRRDPGTPVCIRFWGLIGSGSRLLFRDLGFRDLGFRDLGFRDLGFRDLGFRDLGFRDLGFRDLGFRDLRVKG